MVLTYNERFNLDDCLKSAADWVDESFVVDSGSDDGTQDIARRWGASVCSNPFETHAQQWSWSLRNLPLKNEWVLGLDADQRVSPELRDEIASALKNPSVDGYFIKRRQIFRGKWIRHGGYYPKYLLKLFRRSKVHIDVNDRVDHHFYINGSTAKLRHDLIEANKKEDDLAFWIEKHRRYADLLARQEVERRSRNIPDPIPAGRNGNPDQQALWMKRMWYRMPPYVRPVAYFIYRYFVQLGFLDGTQGLIFHYRQALWFRLLVDMKIHELQNANSRR